MPSTSHLVGARLVAALRRFIILAIPGTLLVCLFLTLQGGSTWWLSKRGHHETTDCLTDSHDYFSIDNMFDEIILEPRNILFWSPFYGSHDFGFGLGQNPFSDHKCPNTNCITTSNRSAIKSADAVVFHWNEFFQSEDIPEYRKKMQKYVFFNMEPPQKFSRDAISKLHKYNGFFNLTMTYMTKSSIFNPFNKFIRKKVPAPKLIAAAQKMQSKKKKMVAWYAHCDEDPLGVAYVRELENYVSVYTYGPCGKLKCGSIDSSTCWDVIEQDYYFFFSIEPALCLDYITERTYRPFQFNVIPVVYAVGNFSRSVPPNSYINVFGFPNPKNLAEFMLSLTKDPGAYMWYMEWKQNWEFVGWGQGFCDLCEVLNKKMKQQSIVNDLADFWSAKDCGRNFMTQFKNQWNGN